MARRARTKSAGRAATDTGRAGGKSGAAAGGAAAYLAASERPWCSLLFLLPPLIAYELYVSGMLSVGWTTATHASHPPRITAFVLIEELFHALGAAGGQLPAAALVGMLLTAHLVRRDPWLVRPSVLLGMLLESAAWAAPLLVLGFAVARFLPLWRQAFAGNPVFLSLGAGIYEEMLFRLIGVSILVCIFRDGFGWPRGVTSALAVLITAVLFSLYHYLGVGEPFLIGPCCFRFLAGAYLGSIYRLRGFGITAGSHAAYDLMVAAAF